jgi:hypothetical protein
MLAIRRSAKMSGCEIADGEMKKWGFSRVLLFLLFPLFLPLVDPSINMYCFRYKLVGE